MPFEIFIIPGLLCLIYGFFRGQKYWSWMNDQNDEKIK